jgi:D-alanine-D-alanine ligase-like ATP-grasp enzyme
MKICVLLPDYSTSQVDYQHYDPPRYLQHLLPNDTIDTVFLNKLTTYKQLQSLAKNGYDIFVNLCEGYLEWEVPSIEVIYFLELLNLPFTGPTSQLYDPPKDLMKYVAYCAGVKTPNYALVTQTEDLTQQVQHLAFPLFVKPSKAGDSLGVDDHSLVTNIEALFAKCTNLLKEYDAVLVEEYIDGREFTVMVAANPDLKTVKTFIPIEYIFPENFTYKTYSLKTNALHPNANIPCTDLVLETALQNAAKAIFKGFFGKGYARMDFRVNAQSEIYFLEINFTCSVFYTDGYEGSADYILKYDGFGQANFLQHIIQEGINRYAIQQKKYIVKGNSIAGYGIYANRNIKANELIFNLEETAQRIATLQHIEKNWDASEKEIFKKYAYSISDEVFLLWSDNPQDWAPQNHSCNANTAYNGLNVLATREIAKGEELTLDYGSFLDQNMQPFNCTCGATNCRGFIEGKLENTITRRAQDIRQLNQKQ